MNYLKNSYNKQSRYLDKFLFIILIYSTLNELFFYTRFKLLNESKFLAKYKKMYAGESKN